MISWPVVVSPVKATLPTPGCAAIAAPGRAARPGHDVEHAGRDPRLECQLAEPDRRQRGVAGGLEDRRVPGGQRRRHLPRGHQQREVPGHDQPDHADRLAQRQVEPGLRDRDRLAEDLVGGAGVVVEDEAHPGDLAARAGDRLADVPALELGQLLGVGLDQRGELGQRPAALAGRPGRPALAVVERAPGGLDRPVDVGRAAERRGRDDLPGRRVDDVERLPVGGIDRLAADDHLGPDRGLV